MKKDIDLISQLFSNITIAWNQGNGDLYASYFTDDCDYITFHGILLKGRASNAKFHNKLFSGFLRGSKLVAKINAIRFLNSDIAIIHQTGAIQLRFQRRPNQGRLSINTNVVCKIKGEWKVSAFHNCRIKREGLFARILRFAKK